MSTERIDWASIHRKMADAEGGAARLEQRSREKTTAVLKARAADLAREKGGDSRAGESLIVLSFSLGLEKYGIETRYIREVTPLNDLTPLPGSPPFVMGIVNVRGQVLSVIDIRILFDLPPQGVGEQDRVIVLQHGGMELGILGHTIHGVIQIHEHELLAALPTLPGIRADFLKGVTKDRTAVLDGARLLTDEKIIVRQEA